MEVKKVKYTAKFAWIYIAFLLQSFVFENLNIFSCSPDVLLTVLVICCVPLKFPRAAILGAFAGAITDAMYGRIFGLNVIMYMYFALLVSVFADEKNQNSPLIMGWICFVSISAYEIVLALLKTMLGSATSIGYLGANIFVKGVFAAVAALLFVLLAQKIKKGKESRAKAALDSRKEAAV